MADVPDKDNLKGPCTIYVCAGSPAKESWMRARPKDEGAIHVCVCVTPIRMPSSVCRMGICGAHDISVSFGIFPGSFVKSVVAERKRL